MYEAELDCAGNVNLLKTIFKPHLAQIEFFSAKERHVLLHGNRGCGKSASLLWKAIQTAYLVPGSRVAIYRKTWPELQRSVWDELLKLPQDLFESVNASNHTVTIKAKGQDGQWKQSKIWFVTAESVADASFHPSPASTHLLRRSDDAICGAGPALSSIRMRFCS